MLGICLQDAGFISFFFIGENLTRTEALMCFPYEFQTLPLVSQSRRLVREGPVIQLMDLPQRETERNIYLHLFNDYLLISLQKE